MTNPYGPPPGPQQPHGGPPSGPQPQQPYGPPSGPQPQQPYPGYPQPSFGPMGAGPAGVLAEWGTRAVGYLIDGAIPMAMVFVLYLIGGGAMAGIIAANGDSQSPPVSFWILIVFMALAYLAIVGFSIWNLCYRRGTTGQTLGQKYMKIKTVSEQTGQPIGFGYAFLRQIVHIVDSIICGLPIGWLAPLWDEKKQTWADKIMSTVVVHLDGPGSMPHGQVPGAPGMPPQGGYPPAPGQPPQGGFPPPGQPPFGRPPQ
ncbi:RDD family protein [Saccharopolyspora griseoalba]|uniref:RDD family protein n=1 Tax=Saccharopolyspora griseoalba TaxID=1431848 RepID=A0ABW2LMX8_9PSEU